MGLVQTKQGSAASGSLTITLDAPTTAGNALIVILASSGTSTNPTSVSSVTLGGSAGNFASVSTFGSASDAAIGATWLDLNCVGGQTSVVITMTGGSGTIATLATVYEWSGLVSSSAFDKTSGGVSAGATTWSSGTTAAVSQPSELLIGGSFVTVSGSTPTITGPSSPWNNLTQVAQVQGTFNDAWMSGYQVVSSGGTATYSGTVSPSSQSISQVNTFKLLVVDPAPLGLLFVPGDSPLGGLQPWGGAPDSDHSVTVNAGTASLRFQSPATRPFLLLALSSETGPGATAITRDDPYAIPLPLLTPDDVIGGMTPWAGAPDSGAAAPGTTVTAGVASVTFTGLGATAGLSVVPGTCTVTLTAQAPASGLSALPSTAALTLTAQGASTALSALPGAATVVLVGQQPVIGITPAAGVSAVSFTGQSATAALSALPGTASVTASVQQEASGLGILPGAALLTFISLPATVSTLEDPQSLPAQLLTPDDVTGGMLPWGGAPQGILTGDVVVNAGVATLTVTAQSPSTALAVGTGTGTVSLAAQAPAAGLGALPGTGSVALAGRNVSAGLSTLPGTGTVSLTARTPATGLAVVPGTGTVSLSAQNPSAAFSGTATPGTATVTMTARSASTALAVGPGTATVAVSSRAPAPGLGALSGTATLGLTALDASVTLPQSAHGRTVSGRETVTLASGREYTARASGREGTARLKGKEPVSSRSGSEPDNTISGREG